MLRIFLVFALVLISQPVDTSISCKFIDTVNITGGYKDINQNFIHKSEVYPLGTYEEFDYIEDYANKKIKVDPHIRGCICKLKPCIRLCCQGDENIFDSNCYESKSFTILNEENKDEIIDQDENKYGVMVGRPCNEMYEVDNESPWKLQKNGSLQSSDGIFEYNHFCFGISNESKVIPYACFEDELIQHQRHETEIIIHTVGMLISIPFLIITFLIYALIPELRNLHGKSLMCYVLALILVNSLLLYAKHNYINKFEAITLYFSIFLTFCWMNVMCIDIWRVSRSSISNRSLRGEQKTFFKYCLYGFGCPLLLTIIAVLIDHHKPFHSDYHPLFGQFGLMGHSKKTKAVYVNIPILILTLINIILFVDTSRRVWMAMNPGLDKKSEKRKEIFKKRFTTCLRLFIIMGVIWLMESIAFFTTDHSEKTSFKHTIFQITDFINSGQGFLIFLVCIADKRTRNLIAKRCRSPKPSNDDGITQDTNFDIDDESYNVMVED